MDKKIGLGKGLSAIMGEIDEEVSTSKPHKTAGIEMIAIGNLIPGKYQPRHRFAAEDLGDLVNSIKTKGVLQPLLVRAIGSGDQYEIIAGERRWRASKQAGLEQLPVIIKDFSDKETLEVALIENLQRQDLNALEEAEGYSRLMSEFRHTQEELASVVGKSRSHVANMMRLLDLPSAVKDMVQAGSLTAGHARALLNAKAPEKLAKKVVAQGLNVRQTEQLAMTEGEKKGRSVQTISVGHRKDGDIAALEAELCGMLKTDVTIRWSGKNGKIVIGLNSLDKLDLILQRLTAGGEIDE